MIWVIANKVEEDGSFPTYKYYKKAFSEGEIDIFCAGEDDDFSFIGKNDVVLVRTRDEEINKNLYIAREKIGFKSTLESPETNELTHDKELVKSVLEKEGIAYPKTIKLEDVLDSRTYFVKARYGENSQGIDENSICKRRYDVYKKSITLLSGGIEPIVEEYINGEDLTTSVINTKEGLKAFSSIIHPNTSFGFHTFGSKLDFAFTALPYENSILDKTCIKVFNAIGAKHYLRIDSRMVGGVPYILDINMIPGLGPVGHMNKCLEMNGIGYHEFIRMVVNSAS